MHPGEYSISVDTQGRGYPAIRSAPGFSEPPSDREYYPSTDSDADSDYHNHGHSQVDVDLSGLTTSQLQTLAVAISKLPAAAVSGHKKTHQKSSRNSTSDSGTAVSISSESVTNSRENALAERALKRAARSAQNKAKAAALKETGNDYFRSEDYSNAETCYVQAIRLSGSNPLYHSNLAAAYLKLKLYDKAELATTSALSLDPKLVKARFRRGIARKELGLIPGAMRDFEAILCDDPTNTEARNEMRSILMLNELESMLAKEENSGRQSDWPHPDQDKLELASMSDSSDCNHVGNGVACRFYNHNGCEKGEACAFSHGPDEKSVRDDLGKNVCVYYLLSACRFGASKCIYSHCKDFLAEKGWWNDAAEKRRVKSFFRAPEHDAREVGGLLWMSRTLGGRKSEVPSAKEPNNYRGRPRRRSKRGNGREKAEPKWTSGQEHTKALRGTKRSGGKNTFPPSRRSRRGMGPRMDNVGFTNREPNEW